MRILIVSLLLLFSCGLNAQRFDFYAEDIEFEVSDSEFSVRGLYFFKNNSEDTIRQNLLYPFPQGPQSGEILQVDATSIYPVGEEQVVVGWNRKAARLRLFILPFDTAVLDIRYKQAIPGLQAEYILTSTQLWEKPLDYASFRLVLPADIGVDSLSFVADDLELTEAGPVYSWRFVGFMPQRNFFVSFRRITRSINRGYTIPDTQIEWLPARSR